MSSTQYEVNVISAFDGGQKGGSIRLDAFHEFITGPHDDSQETLITVEKAYKRVPWFWRGVNLRSDAVARVPWHIETTGGADVTESKDYYYLVVMMRRLLSLTEKSLTKHGRAYWLIESNRIGKKKTPRFIPAKSVTPLLDDYDGIVEYEIKWSNGTKRYSKDEIVQFLLDNDESEILPDTPPAQVALEAAGLLYAANAVPARFYAGGLVPVSLVTVPVTAQDADISKIESFFKRMATGMKKMFSVIGVREGVKVETVGHKLSDSITPEIITAARDDVAVALVGTPTIIDATSANYATASTETVNFILNVVFPECDIIQDAANAQFFNTIGLSFVFDKTQHEIMQTVQLSQAQTAVQLTGGETLLTREEGRTLIGYTEPYKGEDDAEEDEEDATNDDNPDDVEEVDAKLFYAAVAELKRANDTIARSESTEIKPG